MEAQGIIDLLDDADADYLDGKIPWQERMDRRNDAYGGLIELAKVQEETIHMLARVLDGMKCIVNESDGVMGWHLNGALAKWGEFDYPEEIDTALDRVQKLHGGIE